MNISFHPFDLQLKHTFRISREARDFQPTLIVSLNDNGMTGYGEATTSLYYQITTDNIRQDIQNCWDKIQHITPQNDKNSPDVFWHETYPYLKKNMFALCALDEAYNDLYARLRDKKLYELWGTNPQNNPLTNYTIGIDTVEKMVAKLKEYSNPIYKIKLGTHEDMKIVAELRKHTDAIFRIDANCGWSVQETITNSHQLRKLGVEFIEQPLHAEDVEGSERVFKESVLPVIADESCIIEQDVARCHNRFHGINIKLTKCGGLTPARRMIQQAKELNMKVMCGCMTESAVGISAIAHLLPQLDYVDMDSILLLKNDIATGVTLDYGKVFYSDKSGIGTELKRC